MIGDPAVKIVPLPVDAAAFAASSAEYGDVSGIGAGQQEMYPGSTVFPTMTTGASDKAQLRAKGIQSYGIGPAPKRTRQYGAHSDVERLLESSLYNFVEFDWHAVTEMSVHK